MGLTIECDGVEGGEIEGDGMANYLGVGGSGGVLAVRGGLGAEYGLSMGWGSFGGWGGLEGLCWGV